MRDEITIRISPRAVGGFLFRLIFALGPPLVVMMITINPYRLGDQIYAVFWTVLVAASWGYLARLIQAREAPGD